MIGGGLAFAVAFSKPAADPLFYPGNYYEIPLWKNAYDETLAAALGAVPSGPRDMGR